MSTSTIEVNDVPVSADAPFPITVQDFLMTDVTRNNSRLRVDVGQTSFFAGKEFRSFKELSLTNGSTYVIKVVAAVNTILFDLSLILNSGEVKLWTTIGGTEGGTFSETLPIFARNTMSERPTPFYTAQNVLTAGGTHTGGTDIDLLWVKTSGNTNKASNADASASSERGVAAGTYYFRLVALADSTGVLSARWEERP